MFSLLCLLACALPSGATHSPEPQRIWQPPSAHSALVRVVEAASALDSDTAWIEIHGAQSVYHPPGDKHRETVRVRLEVAAVAGDAQAAAAHLRELQETLAVQPWIGGDHPREEQVSYDRVRLVYHQLPWVPGLQKTRPEHAEVQAGTLEVDVDPRGFDPEFAEGGREEMNWEFYIRQVAQQDYVNIGQVTTGLRQRVAVASTHDLIYEIAPAPSERYTLGHIGNFLFKLEEGEERAQITSVEIKSLGENTWTFELELTVRQPDLQGRASDR